MDEKRPAPTDNPIVQILLKNEDLMRMAIEAVPRMVQTIANSFGGVEQMRQKIEAALVQAAKFAEALPAALKRFDDASNAVFIGLLDYAWFFDPRLTMDYIWGLLPLLEQKDEAAIDGILIDHFRVSLDLIETTLATDQPARARLLKDAFKAHREGRYSLSIPVFIAQTDGISCEILGVEYFRNEKSRKRAEVLHGEAEDMSALKLALKALTYIGADREHSSHRRQTIFNRHAIIHGSDTDYDTEINSLKAISALNFMNEVRRWQKEDHVKPAN